MPLIFRINMSASQLEQAQRFERKAFRPFQTLIEGSILEFPENFEAVWNDNFGLRIWFAEKYARFRWFLGLSPSSRFVPGKDGYFFQVNARERNDVGESVQLSSMLDASLGFFPFTPSELSKWEQAVSGRRTILGEKGFEYLFTVAPDKSVIYRDKLPSGYTVVGPGRAEQLLTFLEAKRLPVVNLVKVLLERRISDFPYPIFLKTDSHWNRIGAFFAAQAIIEQSQYAEPHSLDDYIIKADDRWFHKGFSSQIGFPLKEPFYRLKRVNWKAERVSKVEQKELVYEQLLPSSRVKPELMKKNGSTVVKWGGKRVKRMKAYFNPAAKGYDLIVVCGDSFAAKMMPYLVSHARLVLHVKTTSTFPGEFIKHLRPAGPERKVLVIQELAEKYLQTRFPETPEL